MAAALAPLGSTSIAVALPLISAELNVAPGLITQLLVGGYLLVSVAGQIPGGKLVDRWGYQKLLYIGIVVYFLGAISGYLFANLYWLVFARLAMAAGTALIGPATVSLMRHQLPVEWLAISFGVFGTAMGAAAAFGPWIGGVLTHYFGWEAVFLATIPWALFAVTLIFLSAERTSTPATKKTPFDWRGALILAVGVGLLQLGFGAEPNWMLGFSGMVVLGFFALFELRQSDPVFDPRLLSKAPYFASSSITALNNFAMYALLFQIPIFLMGTLRLEAPSVGMALSALTLAMMIAAPVAGVCVRQFGPRYTALAASLFNLAGLYLLADLQQIKTALDTLPGLALLGLGIGFASPAIQTTAIASVSKTMSGMAAGGMSTSRYLGGAMGISLLSMQLGTDVGVITIQQHEAVFVYYFLVVSLAGLIALLLPNRLVVVE